LNHLLKAMGFWVWGLIAIGLSLSLIVANYRMLSIVRVHDVSISAAPRRSAEFSAPAQSALQAGLWQQALQNLGSAELKHGLTSFDEKTIHYSKAYAGIKLHNLKFAQTELEKALATGAATAVERDQYLRTLLGIAAATSQYQKTVDYGEQLVDAGSATPADMTLMAQGYYELKDCAHTAILADEAAAASIKAGEIPKENLFLFKLSCASDAGDNAAMVPILIGLIRLNNKSVYWNTLLRIERQDERDDRNLLMIYRIMYATNAMTAGSDYIEMAQLLRDGAMPAEAQTVLQKAMSGGLLDDQKERVDRLFNSLGTRTEAGERILGRPADAAAANPTRELDVKPEEMDASPGLTPRVLELWRLYAETRRFAQHLPGISRDP
jgi:hypothetical protein